MRTLVVALALLALTTPSEAHGRRKHRTHATEAAKKRIAKASHDRRIEPRAPIHGQSVGVPWSGRLRDATRLADGDGYVIRRPNRSYGTRTTVEYVSRVIADVREQFPDQHVLAIGDISAEDGGQITDHHSHQSGRDVDIGLYYDEQPDGYPDSFVTATADNLDCAATFALIDGFAATRNKDGGVQMIFLDFDVQGLLYHWAKDHDVDDDKLERLFQYPQRGASDALVRHEPNHANHMHVRFTCADGDSACD
jgi:murein endopeptidase